jgi:hypothetical protein
MLSFIDPAIVLSMLMLSFIFVIVCGLFEWKRTCAGFFYRLLIMYCRGRSSYQAVELGSHQRWASILPILTKLKITSHINWTHWRQKYHDIWRWKSSSWLKRSAEISLQPKWYIYIYKNYIMISVNFRHILKLITQKLHIQCWLKLIYIIFLLWFIVTCLSPILIFYYACTLER